MDLTSVKKTLSAMREVYNADLGVLQLLEQDKRDKEHEVELLSHQKTEIGTKKALLQDACEEARKNARDVLQSISTQGLQYIMGDHMSLQIKIDEKRNTSEASFIVRSEYNDYVVENDPAEEDGGGTADIVSISNFFSMNHLAGKRNVAPLLLDEPSKFVSKGHSEQVARFLYEISSYMGKQVFMVTHDSFLDQIGDRAYSFQLDDKGRTHCTRTDAGALTKKQ